MCGDNDGLKQEHLSRDPLSVVRLYTIVWKSHATVMLNLPLPHIHLLPKILVARSERSHQGQLRSRYAGWPAGGMTETYGQ